LRVNTSQPTHLNQAPLGTFSRVEEKKAAVMRVKGAQKAATDTGLHSQHSTITPARRVVSSIITAATASP
jgi:hypothetical protein